MKRNAGGAKVTQRHREEEGMRGKCLDCGGARGGRGDWPQAIGQWGREERREEGGRGEGR